MSKLILFLVMKKLGVKPYEKFRFVNQKSKVIYYFTATKLMKDVDHTTHRAVFESGVGLNWLLDPECKVCKINR